MKKKIIKRAYWRKLDDQAKVFTLASNKKYSSIYRLSVLLKENIDKELLQKATELAISKYRAYKVKLKTGLFWYYFEENELLPVVSEEVDYPFKKINDKANNEYLFKVTYFHKKINLEVFHALTDGNGAILFLNEIVYRYLEMKYPNEIPEHKKEFRRMSEDTEDAYKKSYVKKRVKTKKIKKAYMLQGEELDKGEYGITHNIINLKELKEYARSVGCSLSEYLVALIAYSIYETNYRIYNGKRPINISVPINLKKYIKTETISNFFSYMQVSIALKEKKVYTFDDVLILVKKEFEKKLILDKILSTITKDAGSTNNIFVRIVPLVLKKLAFRIGSMQVKRKFTTSFSNVGIVSVEDEYKPYVDGYFVILSPDWAEKIKCGIVSYENDIVVTFSTILKDNLVENKFKELLKERNISVRIEGNDLVDVSN
ncbi:MAG: hypothetical protein IKK84_04805 [Clostridia bacterium]|nr:hypothetical protein [Clostridia bacterium]